MIDILREAIRRPVLDSSSGPEGASMSESEYTMLDISLMANAVVNEWVEISDLDDGETLADRLNAMLIGIADADMNGEVDDDEQEVIAMAMEAAGNYMDSLGVDSEDIGLLINDKDNEAAMRVQDLLSSSMPDDGTYDSVAFDATYKKRAVVRDGKKTWVKKRVSGKVRLSPKQKLSLKKAQRKAHSASARMGRMKSMKKRKSMGL
jgi:hypothetical protein